MRRTWGMIIGAALAWVSLASAQPVYHLIDLGRDFAPANLNDRNVVVGTLLDGPQRQARWANGELKVFGRGGLDSINELGVFTSWGSSEEVNQFAVRGIGGRVQPLTASPTFGATEATCVDRQGRPSGYGFDGTFVYPLAWPAFGGQATALATLGADGAVFACSPAGRRAGYAINALGELACVTWDLSGQIHELPSFDGGALCTAVNDAGVSVGLSWANDYEFPVKWLEGSIVTLPLIEGAIVGWASGINASGLIVGTQWSEQLPTGRGVLWTTDGAVYDLNDLLVDAPFGLLLTSAGAINTAGSITATGTLRGEEHGFLLMPVNPVTSQVLE